MALSHYLRSTELLTVYQQKKNIYRRNLNEMGGQDCSKDLIEAALIIETPSTWSLELIARCNRSQAYRSRHMPL